MVYFNSRPFPALEDKYTKDFLLDLHYKPPTREAFSTILLNQIYEKVRDEVQTIIHHEEYSIILTGATITLQIGQSTCVLLHVKKKPFITQQKTTGRYVKVPQAVGKKKG
jgi:hypothetical protein